MMKRVGVTVTVLVIALAAIWAGTRAVRHFGGEGGAAQSAAFQPPPDSAIPNDQFGDTVRQGEKIFHDPGKYAPAFVGNKLSCVNCHLSGGRLANSAPLWAAYISYPAYRSKNGHVNTFAERLQGCFRYSMNGKAPALGDPTLVALETYAYFLAKGAPTGVPIQGRGFPKLPKPDKPADYQRGMAVYSQNCAVCHGANGEGKSSGGHEVFPPLWGTQSYNWGAGMAGTSNAAGFIKANMPLGLGGTLTVQQAWDVATYIDSQVRPQDPRFTGDVAQTRKKYHNSGSSMYGTIVDGVLLGDPAHTPPSGTVPAASPAAVAVAKPEVHRE
ncbi:c-type cytochrome [Paraburkholderia nodosa]|uniref:c-type cytochrome n=1 Tax=Paraburkholderia nodosa TaxID=392320 RepID=UPI0004AE57D9|nr:c-type cytochrome [Paraburkholderia nodosa]